MIKIKTEKIPQRLPCKHFWATFIHRKTVENNTMAIPEAKKKQHDKYIT